MKKNNRTIKTILKSTSVRNIFVKNLSLETFMRLLGYSKDTPRGVNQKAKYFCGKLLKENQTRNKDEEK